MTIAEITPRLLGVDDLELRREEPTSVAPPSADARMEAVKSLAEVANKGIYVKRKNILQKKRLKYNE